MSNGTLRHDATQVDYDLPVWLIDCLPHIKLRLKRVFGKVARWSHGQIVLSDTIERCRDLAWFIQRYPLEINGIDLAHLTARAKLHEQRERDVAAIVTGNYKAEGFELVVPARNYQKQAAALALETRGLLVADAVGLGKTCVAIAMLTDPRTRPALVVTLTHLPKQWERELQKFAPNLRVHILEKGTPYDLGAPKRRRGKRQQPLFNEFPDVIISNYHKLSGWADSLSPLVKTVVFDECAELRRGEAARQTSAKYRAAKHLADHADFRCGLSATPIFNYGGEMFAVLECIRPGVLGTYSEFLTEWGQVYGGDNAMVTDPEAFGAYLRAEGLMLRRTRAEVGRELPEMTVVPHYIDADPKALEEVAGTCAELCRFILRGQQTEKGELMHAGGELDYRLRQATGIAKAAYVAKFVELLVDSGEKVVLYGWHHEVYNLWRDLLAGLGPAFFTGRESTTQKERAKQEFISGEARVLIMSLRAGAGLDGLQGAAHTVVFGELDWSPGVHDQCAGRVHRDGQHDPVTAYYLIAETGSDPVIADVLGLKRSQSDPVLDPDRLVELQTSDPNRITRMAEAFLRQRGEPVPQPASDEPNERGAA